MRLILIWLSFCLYWTKLCIYSVTAVAQRVKYAGFNSCGQLYFLLWAQIDLLGVVYFSWVLHLLTFCKADLWKFDLPQKWPWA